MNSIDQELREAIRENNLPEVSRLLSVGADVNATNTIGWTPLGWACHCGYAQVVKELLDHGADIDAKDDVGDAPLHDAALSGHVTIVNELRSRGANIEVKNSAGNTPLHIAATVDHLPIVKALLSGGANILAGNRHSAVNKCLLRHYYATTRRLPLHELLEDLTGIGNRNRSDDPPLLVALHLIVLGTDDVVEMVEYLVERNPALLRSRDQDGSLLLHVACRRGAAFTIVQSLVNRYKGSVKSVTSQGDLPLFLACEVPEPSLDTIFLLMKLSPDLVYR
jgi:ankyrin repeat protein